VKRYALDSDTVSFILRKQEKVLSHYHAAVVQRSVIYIPPYVYYEIQRWISLKEAAGQQRIFDGIYEDTGLFPITVTELDRAISLYVSLTRRGITIGDSDILIAAFCLEHGFILVTNNTDHFKHIPALLTVNWNI